MPRKLRAAKQRRDDKAEVERWSMTFECGHDYFRETGFLEAVHVWPPEDRPRAEGHFAQRRWPRGVASVGCSTEARRRRSAA
jgi:hypothetical protein